ncbi:unnamed protein product [Rhizoctonia solani]|uniref:Fungal-type protein kinase domain-containing protein n=1 Tax=Rhizoctonia solani TaxID=456999 RepID=A0A8H3GHF8_9AGAM|nr:unnamed protein product [Rhizoctonia solani]CAE6450149.1 unnamed protein product [Rhizoctonia solani]
MTAAQRHPGQTQPIQVDCNRKQALALSVLYYKTAIRGRATLILALKPVLDPSSGANLADKAMVLKLIWRDQARFREGLILGQFSGVHGLCQKLFEGDVLIGGSPDVVYPRQDLSPGPLGDVFGSGTDKVDVQGAIQDSAHVQSQLLMQPGRPLKEALNEFELVAGMIGALMGHWALVRNQVQHRDISINNIILPDGHEYTHDSKALEWERLREYGAGRCAQEFVVPDWVGLFNEPNEPKYKSVEKLEWNFDPKRRLLVLEKVIRDLGRSEPFGFLSDLDMANILSLSRSDVHMDRTVSGYIGPTK